jgi:hypothetical protein
MILSIPWVKPIIKWVQKEELEAKKNTESIINFNSKTLPSTTLTSHTAVFSTGQIPCEL